jgi:mono/diheme cytochrome c family protein
MRLAKECAMKQRRPYRCLPAAGKVGVFVWAGLVLTAVAAPLVAGGLPWKDWWQHRHGAGNPCSVEGPDTGEAFGGQWYWVGSPEQQKRITMSQYNRYCVRCHGIDGRGVWDIPDVPDFTNARWQACRSDAQLVCNILEGRGAVMPAFRGTLTLEEAWAMARYLRTFQPGSETSRPDLGGPDKERQPNLPPPMPRPK